MSEMIERVAVALWADEHHPGTRLSPLDGDNKTRLIRTARAAIEAMREPTEAMSVEGLRKPTGMLDWQEAVRVSWRAMIDEALK